MENPRRVIAEPTETSGFALENPFSFKFAKVFTGVGVGCGVGIGVGQPLHLGAIPMLQQVMSATRGATDAFSGVGRHANSSLRKLGINKVQAGVGCGIGIGHGFGVGIALKPGVIHQIQSSVMLAVTKLMSNLGVSESTTQSFVPGFPQSSTSTLTSSYGGNALSSSGSVVDLESKTGGSSVHFPRSNGNLHRNLSTHDVHEPQSRSDSSGSHTEKVIDNFFQNPIFKQDEDIQINEMAKDLHRENNVLHVLLEHQQVIQRLVEENQKLQKILIEDLKVPPSKLHAVGDTSISSDYSCSDCIECRRRKRRGRR